MNLRGIFRTLSLSAAAALLLTVVSASSLFAAEGDLLDVRAAADQPVKLIFDTDIGGDIDDAFALGMIHALADRGKCELLGVTTTNTNPVAGEYVAALNALYGRPEIPVGVGLGYGCDTYLSKTLAQKTASGEAEFPVPANYEKQDAVAVLRKILAAAEDNSVVIAQVGTSSNLAALLDTPADDVSPMTGLELAARKVRLVSVMGGAFTVDPTAADYAPHREWNIICDIPAAQKFAKEWPGEIVFSGFELGDRVRMVPASLKNDLTGRAKFLHDSFGHWANEAAPNEGFNHERPTWDLTAVLFVVRPEAGRDYFTLSEPGDVAFTDEGVTVFTSNPDAKRRCYLQDDAARIRVREAFVNLCSEP